MQDTYWSTPQGTYEERRHLYLEYCASQPGAGWLGRYARIGFFSQIAAHPHPSKIAGNPGARP